MFTGIVEETGLVRGVSPHSIDISAALAGRVRPGDSVAVSGVCLTASHSEESWFGADISEETLSKTSLGKSRAGSRVNLETALTLSKPVGGHWLLGHVDCTGVVQSVEKSHRSWTLSVRIPAEFLRLVVPRGSLGVDGISLTIASLSGPLVQIALIPHTLQHTTIGGVRPGDAVNLEFDVLGKYVVRYLETLGRPPGPGLTTDTLRDLGF